MHAFVTATALVALALGCGSKKEAAPAADPAAQPEPAAPAVPDRPPPPVDRPAEKATPTPGGALPEACNDYRATIEKLAQCGEGLPQTTRDGLKANFEREWDGWERTPAEARAGLTAVCKSAAANVKAAAAAACGW